jgi:hypothetical protein
MRRRPSAFWGSSLERGPRVCCPSVTAPAAIPLSLPRRSSATIVNATAMISEAIRKKRVSHVHGYRSSCSMNQAGVLPTRRKSPLPAKHRLLHADFVFVGSVRIMLRCHLSSKERHFLQPHWVSATKLKKAGPWRGPNRDAGVDAALRTYQPYWIALTVNRTPGCS